LYVNALRGRRLRWWDFWNGGSFDRGPDDFTFAEDANGGGDHGSGYGSGGGADDGVFQRVANWGAEEGGAMGWVALNTGAGLAALAAIEDAVSGVRCEEGVCYGSPPAVTTIGAFTRGGFLNTNRYLRIGIGRHG